MSPTVRPERSLPFSDLFFQPQQRQGVWGLLNWYRFVDETATHGSANTDNSLREIQAQTARAFNDWTEAEGPYRALGWAAEHFSIQEDHALELIQGLRFDAQGSSFADEDALLRHCHQVGGSVSLMLCSVLDVRDRLARSHAVAIGQAIQLTKMARDIPENLKRQRLHIPESWLTHTGLTRTEFAEFPFRRVPLVLKTLDKAEELYSFGLQGLRLLPWRAALATASAALIYRAIGRKIRQQPLRSQQRTMSISLPVKLYWIVRAVFLTISSRRSQTA